MNKKCKMTKQKYLQRQGIRVIPQELRNLADKLEIEFRETLGELGDIRGKLTDNKINSQSFLVSIVNKTKESDTWEFEK